MNLFKILILVGAVFTLTGCYHIAKSPVGVSAPEVTVEGAIPLRAFNFGYSPANFNARVGESVNLNISSNGAHTFTIDELGVNQRLSKGENTVIFTPGQEGTFEYYCAIPGHRERGMIGELTVSP